MGWEDPEYGVSLTDHGYHQVIACDVIFDDSYEYAHPRPVGGSYRVVNKPAWTTYYLIRNLILSHSPQAPFRAICCVVSMRLFSSAS